MTPLKILAFCGSLRKESLNRKLLLLACDELKELKCDVTFLDLRSLELPIYDGDLEESEGLPAGGQKLISEISAASAVVIASPEYNGSVSGALKNAIDWATRGEKNPFIAKPMMIVGTSPGHWGASKSLIHLRQILVHLQAVVIPAQLALPYGSKAFDSAGGFVEAQNKKILVAGCSQLVQMTQALQN